MNASVIEVDVRPLEAENLACPHPYQGEDNEQRAPWLLGQVEDGLDLRTCKVRGDVVIALDRRRRRSVQKRAGGAFER